MIHRIILSYLIAFPLLMQAQGMWTVYDTSNSTLPGQNILDISVDKDNNVWVILKSTPELVKLTGSVISVYDRTNSINPGYGNKMEYGVSGLWISGRQSPSSPQYAQYLLNIQDSVWTIYDSLSTFPNVTNMTVDGTGDLWATSEYIGLFRFRNGQTTRYTGQDWGLSPYVTDNFYALACDRNNILWFISDDLGTDLLKFNRTNPATIEGAIELGYEFAIDRFDNFWGDYLLSTTTFPSHLYYAGLRVIQPDTTLYFDSISSGLPSNKVVEIAIDNNDVKWIATSGGLARFDDTSWVVYNTSNSLLPSNNVQCIAIDQSGNKWIGTDKGLAKFTDGGAGPITSGFKLSGNVLSETGVPIPGVTVILSGDENNSVITATDGKYSFNVEPGGNYTITPSKNNDITPNNGISTADVLLMRRHTLGIAPLPSPYKIIAAAEANADGDTNVSTIDILRTRELILGNSASFPTNRLWQFVSSDYVFPDASNPFPFDKTRTYTNITTNQTNQDFIGIKLGDVNGSWDAGVP